MKHYRNNENILTFFLNGSIGIFLRYVSQLIAEEFYWHHKLNKNAETQLL